MLGLRTSITSLLSTSSSYASSSRITLTSSIFPTFPTTFPQQVRFRGQLAPRRTKYRKAQKGHPSIPTGGSLKGSTLEQGTFGIRVLASTRLTADQLTSATNAIKRKIKPVKGAICYLRVFPDVPVCVKGNETRMGKGKGGFEYWACRVPVGRVVFEIGGGNIREEIAKQALRLAQVKLPVQTEFITSTSSARQGNLTNPLLVAPASASPSPQHLVELDSEGEGSAVDIVMKREEMAMEDVVKDMAALEVGSSGVGSSDLRT